MALRSREAEGDFFMSLKAYVVENARFKRFGSFTIAMSRF